MRIRIHNWLFFLLVSICSLPCQVRAQEFLDIDWGVMQIDSVLPVFSHTIPLETD